MIRKTALILGVALLATPAFAGHCPLDAAAVDAGLQKLAPSDAMRAQAVALKEAGMQFHEAGNHAEAEAKLSEAMRFLLSAE